MKHTKVFPCLVMALAAAATASAQQTPDWPRWRGPNGDGTTAETGWNPMSLQGGAKVLWKADVGYGYSSVAIKAGRLYTMGGGTGEGVHFWCLDAATGERIWEKIVDLGDRFSNAWEQMWATPATDGERAFWISKTGRVYCLRAADGELLWMKDLLKDFGAVKPGWEFAASPVIEGDLLLVNADTVLLALDKATGDARWRIDDLPDNGDAASTPVVRDIAGTRRAFFVGAYSASVIEVATGKKLWSWPVPYAADTTISADPVISGSKVFLSMVRHSYLLDLTRDPPEYQWVSDVLTSSMASPVLIGGYLYGTREGAVSDPFFTFSQEEFAKFSTPLQCVEFATGKVMWAKEMPYVSILVADGKLLLLEINGTLHIGEGTPGGYRELSAADVLAGGKRPRNFSTPPVLCNGRIYCRNYAGDLVCIDVSK